MSDLIIIFLIIIFTLGPFLKLIFLSCPSILDWLMIGFHDFLYAVILIL
jgi:hypothetical protein